MGFVRAPHTVADTHRRLLDLVERLATQFEGEVGIKSIIIEVQRAREAVRLMRLSEADHLDLIESVARSALSEQTGDDVPSPPPQRHPGDDSPA